MSTGAHDPNQGVAPENPFEQPENPFTQNDQPAQPTSQQNQPTPEWLAEGNAPPAGDQNGQARPTQQQAPNGNGQSDDYGDQYDDGQEYEDGAYDDDEYSYYSNEEDYENARRRWEEEQQLQENGGKHREPRYRDFWGREQTRCCDCIRHCCRSCCVGFCTCPYFEFRRICGFPHGICYTLMGLLLAVGGLLIQSFYIISCDVERVAVINDEDPNAKHRKYGFLSRQPITGEMPSYMGCIMYTAEDKAEADLFNIWMYGANFALFLSTLFGLIGFVVIAMALCVAWSPNTFEHWMMWNYILAAITIPFSYLIFGAPFCSEHHCKLGKGGLQAISILLFWLCAANTVKSFPQAPPAEDDEDVEEDNDDLYYETEEDMWRDRAPPPKNPYQRRRRKKKHMDPNYIDDYVDYGDETEEDGFINNNHQDRRMEPMYDEYGNPIEERYNDDLYDNDQGRPNYYPQDGGDSYYDDRGYADDRSREYHQEDGPYESGHYDDRRPQGDDDDGPIMT